MKKHKWYKEIKALAAGKELQWSLPRPDPIWNNTPNDPIRFNPLSEAALLWRIKPEPKPDIVLYGVENSPLDSSVSYTNCNGVFVLPTILTAVKTSPDNVKFIFDGETGKLKSVEILK